VNLVPENDPALYRRRLRSELRKIREETGLSHREVTSEMDWSPSKLSRIEAGTVAVSTNDLRALLNLYQVTDRGKAAELVDIARKARERSPWWHQYRNVASAELISLCGYESSAKVLRNFEPLMLPGLLQTEGYARELLRHLRGSKDPRRIDALVSLRLHRQELLAEKADRRQHFLIDEAAIRRVIGGPAVMQKQLHRLRDAMHSPSITINIIPFSLGMYRGLRVPYVIYEFEDPQDETILYLEDPAQESVYFEEPGQPEGDEGAQTPAVYLEIFFELEHVVSEAETTAILDDAIDQLTRTPQRSQPFGDDVVDLTDGEHAGSVDPRDETE
jgi:transcriptional regulator with XRE-family HTH domain